MTYPRGMMMASQLDYQPPPVVARRQIFSIAGTACGAALSCVLAVASVITLQFKQIFIDFGMKLPLITQFLLGVMEWLRETYLLPLLLFPVIGGFTLPLIDYALPAQNRRVLRGSIGLIIMLVMTLIITLVVVVGLFLPIISLIQGMSGGGKR